MQNFDPLQSDDCYEQTEVMKERATKAQPVSAWEKVRDGQEVQTGLRRWIISTRFFTTLWNFTETDSYADDPAHCGRYCVP